LILKEGLYKLYYLVGYSLGLYIIDYSFIGDLVKSPGNIKAK